MVSDFGTIYATWTDPDGDVWQLSNTAEDLGWFTPNGPAGWGAGPVEVITDPLATGGVSVRTVRFSERRLTWPLYVWGDTHDEFVARYRNLLSAFAKTGYLQSPGTLTVQRPDGTSRSIDCFYEDGFQGTTGENWSFAKPVLTLLCPDPFWRADTAISTTRTFSAQVPYLSPYPTVSNSNALGASTLNNPGDVDVWPNFTITGPMTQMQATNATTGDSFTIEYTLTTGQTVTVTTNPPTVTNTSGDNLIGALNFPDAVLWRLVPGDNSLDFSVNGGATGTSVEISFTPKYGAA